MTIMALAKRSAEALIGDMDEGRRHPWTKRASAAQPA
jgi:hypothetical protein